MRVTPAVEPRARINPKIVLAVWAAYALVAGARQDLGLVVQGRDAPFWYGFAMQLPVACYWAALTPLIIWLGRRFPLRRPGWVRHAALHVPVSLALVFCLDLLFATYFPLLAGIPTPPLTVLPLLREAENLFTYWVMEDMVVYWVIIAVSHALDAGARARFREMHESQLESQLAQAELQALKMQIHPHFLFNALHTVGTLVRTGESSRAVQVLGRLGDLLRRMLDGAATQEVPLREELEFARNYLAVEQARFPDRLRVTWAVDSSVLEASVPHLVLQPLLENAIRHGIATSATAGALTVEARRSGAMLHLTVYDDGPGVEQRSQTPDGWGVGLANIQHRLTRLYGDHSGLEVTNREHGGASAHVFLPYRPAPAT